ncbi:MAG: hypothetical protein R2882_11535 [Gemmatimonadales bacterium]
MIRPIRATHRVVSWLFLAGVLAALAATLAARPAPPARTALPSTAP